MRYLSVCSGIESATVAWKPLGWQAVAFSEIERFPCSVLAHHYPAVPNRGDMNDFATWPDASLDVLVGGTPCQSFSVAGLRAGLADPRGNLALVYLALADRYRPRWLVWENVPGVLSSHGGRDFGSIIGAMVKLGYGFAYRVLDAQYFGVPQRRRRVFVVGHLGDWRPATAVLFEPESLRRNPPPRREAGQVAPTVPSRSSAGGGLGTDFDCDGGLMASTGPISHCLNAGGMGRQDYETETLVSHVAIPIQSVQSVREKKQNGIGIGDAGDEMFTLTGRDRHAVAFAQNQREEVRELEVAGAISAIRRGDAKNETLLAGMAVRRLTPLECERLQGFPDGYTDIPGASDSARYKALGNSMAVPVMRWIGQRIDSLPHRDP